MATLTSDQAAAGYPVFQGMGRGQVCVAKGKYTLTANPTAADIAKMCKIPAGAEVFAGWVRAQDIDTGTGALDFDLGWAANGGSGTFDAADPDGFGNFGALNGTAVTNYLPEGGILLPFQGVLAANGWVTFTRETTLQLVFNTPANAGGTGTIAVIALYSNP